jgi:outer membrane protein assembly factor BamA
MDVVDLIRKLRDKDQAGPDHVPFDYRKRMIAASPVIGAKPSAGVIVGVAGNAAFYRGDPSTTGISSGVGSVTVTSKKQAGVNARTTIFSRDDRWRTEGDYRFQWTSQETFGLGTGTVASAGEVVHFDFYRFHQSAQYRLRRRFFVGGGLNFDSHTDVGPEEGAEATWPDSAYYAYSVANGLPLETQMSAGPAVDIIWDSRDNFINPDRGWLARAGYVAMFDGFLGGSSTWQKVNVDVRAYPSLSSDRRHKLAIWAYADLVVGGVVPYFDLPFTAGDPYGRSGRGYAEGHFRGEKLAFIEIEYRGSLMRNGLLGMVVFLNSTTVSNQETGEELFDRFAPGGGAGLRLLLNKRSKTNLAFDIAFGENGNHGAYLAVQEAF